MNTLRYSLFAFAVVGLLGVPWPIQAEEPAGVEVLARGPVHEAYAEPTDLRPPPSILVNKQPPDPVPELPPDQKPADESVVWIPGYWAWADDTSDFLWVSGFWRVPPPGRQWVPGNWQQVDGGWQWVSGYWAATDQTQVTYLPPPPPSVDAGPSTPAPEETSIYVSGCWVWRDARYFWRPGYWVNFRPDWLWVPAHYLWTPCGYVFVDGYWDRPLATRGLLFAPVRFDRQTFVADWHFRPQYVVQTDFLLSSFFVRPAGSHYYFGDYFGESDAKRGFVSWVDYRVGRHAYDPNFAYYRAAFARDPGWERGIRELYTGRRDGSIARPPHTWVQQTQAVQTLTKNRTEKATVHENLNITNLQNVTALAPLTQVQNTRITHLSALAPKAEMQGPVVKLAEVSRQDHAQLQKHVEAVRQVAQERSKVEAGLLAKGQVPSKPTDTPHVAKLTLPPTPPAARPAGKAAEPPPVPKAPVHVEKTIPAHEPIPAARPPKVEPKPVPGPEVKPAPKADPKAPAPKPEPPAPAPKTEPKPPAPAPKAEPKPPTPAPRPEPPPQPKPEPAPPPAPKVEPKPPAPAPKPEPPPAPPPVKPNPMPAPAPAPKVEPKPPAPKPPTAGRARPDGRQEANAALGRVP